MAKKISVQHRTSPVTTRRKRFEKDPNRHYHWAKGDPFRVAELVENYEYRIERQEDYDAKVGDPGSLEGAITVGGDVLLSCSRKKWEERQEEQSKINRDFAAGPRESFKTEAMKRGVETVDKSKETRGSLQSAMSEK